MTHQVELYLTTSDLEQAVSDVIPLTAVDMYPSGFPGYVGQSAENLPTDAYTPSFLNPTSAMDTPSGNIDYQQFGNSGEVNRNSYAIGGPVEPKLVENFDLTGQVIRNPRRPEYSPVGDVGSYDHSSYTLLQISQQMSPDAYTLASLQSLLGG